MYALPSVRGFVVFVVALVAVMSLVQGQDRPASQPAGTGSAPASQATSAASLRRVHVFLTGRVQGVSYRAWTQKQALQVGVKGWVMNLPDGRVEAVLQGAPQAVAALLENMRKGPPAAQVEKVEVRDEQPKPGEFTDFQVLYKRP